MASEREKTPPWLTKYIEAKRFSADVEKFKRVNIISVDEFIESLRDVYWKARGRGFRGRELARLEAIYRKVYDYLRTVSDLPSTRNMNEFHREIVIGAVGNDYDAALAKVRRARDIVRKLYYDYRLLITTASSAFEAKRYRKEGLGRILSVFRRLQPSLEVLEKVRREILSTHIISEGLPAVVVAGAPNTGKSTLVRRVSTAEPEIAPYPFTTKTIIVGKAWHNSIPFYIIDTPGLLEASLETRSAIERKAVAALAALADAAVLMLDPSAEASMDLERQVELLKELKKFLESKSVQILVVVNKIDLISDRRAGEVESILLANGFDDIVWISALHGTNIDHFLDKVVERIRESVLRKWFEVKGSKAS